MQKKKPNMFTVGSSTRATFVLLVRHGTCVAVQTKRMETDMSCGVMIKQNIIYIDTLKYTILYTNIKYHILYTIIYYSKYIYIYISL